MIKKIICLIAILFSISLTTIAPTYATEDSEDSSAQAKRDLGDCVVFLGLKSWDCGLEDLNKIQGQEALSGSIWTIVVNVLDNITVLAAYLIIGYIIYGGYLYLLSGGESNKVVTGKKAIIHGITGLTIVSLANIIMNTIRLVLLQGNRSLVDCVSQECAQPEKLFANSIHWVIGISSLVAVIFIIYGSILFITSSGDSNKVKKAKDTITYAVIGLIIVGLAEAIVLFVTNILNNGA